jgi:hypothetical protein
MNCLPAEEGASSVGDTRYCGGGTQASKRMINYLGPVLEEPLLPGERVAVRTRQVLSRKGRCVGPMLLQRHLEMSKEASSKKENAQPVAHVNQDQPVHDSSGLGPDLAMLTDQQRHSFWILAVSVFSKSKVIRKPSQLKLLAIWDYAGKIWYQGMDRSRIQSL